VIAVDTNILVYAHRRDSEFFQDATAAIRRLAESQEHWAIPWPCIHEFLAIVTHPRIFQPPSPLETAIAQVEIWLESPVLRLIGESGAYWPTFVEILAQGKIVGPKVHDARIAAVCRSHGIGELWSADRDFSRMRGVKVINPVLNIKQ
jgi:toxin-antitoxin system PIN domain toxin